MNIATSSSLAGDLLLARLLAAGQTKLAPGAARASLGDVLPEAPGVERWQALLDELTGAGLVTVKPLRLTDAGRAQALAFLGADRLPPRANWRTVKARFLVPKALGIAPDAADAHRRIGRLDGLQAYLLKRGFGLPVGAGASLGQALEALVCRELGYEEATTLAKVMDLVLSRLVGAGEPLNRKALAGQLACRSVNARGVTLDAMRTGVLKRWGAQGEATTGDDGPVDRGPDEAPPDGALDVSVFAHTVRAAARHCPTRFGDNKVFISHVWRQLRQEPGFRTPDLAAFKRELIQASKDGLIQLTRADFVEAMDPADVRESETAYLGTAFHFILLEREQP